MSNRESTDVPVAPRPARFRAELIAIELAKANFELLVARQAYDAALGAQTLKRAEWEKAARALYGQERGEVARKHGVQHEEK